MERSGKLILVIAIFFMGNVFAQEEEEVITKEEAIALALERNYGIEIAENEVEIAENNQGITSLWVERCLPLNDALYFLVEDFILQVQLPNGIDLFLQLDGGKWFGNITIHS